MKTLYVDIDEDITDLLEKISTLKSTQVLLVIPKSAAFFRNSINLKLLKKRVEEEGKDLQVFTNDEKGLQMLQKADIKRYQGHLKKRKKSKEAQLGRMSSRKVEKQTSKRVSITEVSAAARKQRQRDTGSTPQKKLKKKKQREWSKIFLLNTLRKRTIMGFTTISLLFFFIVIYVAVPSATIALTPSSNVLEATVNVTIADRVIHERLFRNPSAHLIPSFPIELTFEKSILYEPTGKVFTGSKARCNLKLTNERNSPWVLVEKTRFEDPSGVVFRSRDEVTVPAARFQVVRDEEGNATNQKIPGTLIVSVTADEFDEDDNVIGARGNLPANTNFNLPGLSAFNQGLLYATNEKPCIGGVTEFYRIVAPEDIEASQQKIVDELEAAARQYLVDYVDGENVKRANPENQGLLSPQLVLLDNPQLMKFDVLKTTVPDNLEGQKTDQFSVSGEMRVFGIAYESQSYYELLEQGLLARVHPSKVLSSIDFESTTENVVYSDSDLEELSRVKISSTVRGVEEFNFDPRSDQGKEIIDRILDFVPNKSQTEASYFISNLEEIQKAHISIWPFWKNTLPERKSSITIKVQ